MLITLLSAYRNYTCLPPPPPPPPPNSAKSRLMALSVPPTFPPTHSFASGSNKLSNYSSSSSSHWLANNEFGQEERHSSNLYRATQPTARTKSAPPNSEEGKCPKTEACKHSSLPPLPKVNTELFCKPGWGRGAVFPHVFRKKASPFFAGGSTSEWINLQRTPFWSKSPGKSCQAMRTWGHKVTGGDPYLPIQGAL